NGLGMATLAGDPEKTGSSFIVRFRATREVEVGPHWHPGDEHLTVIQGVYRLGYGEKYVAAGLEEVGAGPLISGRENNGHFAWYGAGTIVQVNGIGPFRTFYV